MRIYTEDGDSYLLPEARSSMQLAALRVRAITRWLEEEGPPVPRFTCSGCSMAPRCVLVYDNYNTDDACLLEK